MHLRSLLVLLCAALALVVAANSSLAVALPEVAVDLGAGQADLTWAIDGYALTFAALLLPAGIAADRWGRRSVLTAGLLVFGGANLASAFAGSAEGLVALRALSGVGAAAVFPVTLSALVDAYPPERRGFAIAVWSGVTGAGAVLGTLVAGALLEGFWWGSIQVVFGAAALALVPGVLAVVAQRRNPALPLDVPGAALSVLGLGGLVYAVVEGARQGWDETAVLVAGGASALGIGGFIVHELRTAHPSLDVRLFRHRGLAAGSLLTSLQFFASLGMFVLAPQWLQVVRGYSPLQAALALLVIAVGTGIGTGLATKVLAAVGAPAAAATGLVVMATGFAVLAVGLDSAPLGVLGVGVLLFGLGFGLSLTPGTMLIIEGLPADRRSVASAVNDITREVGGVLGIAVLSSVLLTGYRDAVADTAAGLPDGVSAAVRDGAGQALGVAASLGADGGAVATAARAAFTEGLSDAFWVASAVLAATALAVVALAVLPARAARSSSLAHQHHWYAPVGFGILLGLGVLGVSLRLSSVTTGLLVLGPLFVAAGGAALVLGRRRWPSGRSGAVAVTCAVAGLVLTLGGALSAPGGAGTTVDAVPAVRATGALLTPPAPTEVALPPVPDPWPTGGRPVGPRSSSAPSAPSAVTAATVRGSASAAVLLVLRPPVAGPPATSTALTAPEPTTTAPRGTGGSAPAATPTTGPGATPTPSTTPEPTAPTAPTAPALAPVEESSSASVVDPPTSSDDASEPPPGTPTSPDPTASAEPTTPNPTSEPIEADAPPTDATTPAPEEATTSDVATTPAPTTESEQPE